MKTLGCEDGGKCVEFLRKLCDASTSHLPWADLASQHAFIAPIAYDASLNADVGAETQKSLTQLNKTIIGSLPEELVAHLKQGENAGWIYSMQPSPHYGLGILLQVTGHSDMVCICSCGHRSKVHGPNV